jgi:hypothetical protein
MNVKIKQYVVFAAISFLFAPVIIDHQIILDCRYAFERTTLTGFFITGACTFVALMLLEWSFDINNKK